MAKKANSTDNRIVEFGKDVVYASLGAQKVAFEFGTEKYEAFTKARKKDLRNYVKRGEELEAQIKEVFEEFKGSDSLVAKGVATVEAQVEKVAKLAGELGDKVASVAGVKKKAPARKRSTAKRPAAKRRSPARKAAAA